MLQASPLRGVSTVGKRLLHNRQGLSPCIVWRHLETDRFSRLCVPETRCRRRTEPYHRLQSSFCPFSTLGPCDPHRAALTPISHTNRLRAVRSRTCPNSSDIPGDLRYLTCQRLGWRDHRVDSVSMNERARARAPLRSSTPD